MAFFRLAKLRECALCLDTHKAIFWRIVKINFVLKCSPSKKRWVGEEGMQPRLIAKPCYNWRRGSVQCFL